MSKTLNRIKSCIDQVAGIDDSLTKPMNQNIRNGLISTRRDCIIHLKDLLVLHEGEKAVSEGLRQKANKKKSVHKKNE